MKKRPIPFLQIAFTFLMILALSGVTLNDALAKPAARGAKKPVAAAKVVNYDSVTSTDLLKEPKQYLDKDVQLDGVFSSFSSVGLDYKKAFRDSRDFVALVIFRPELKDHTIPMGELKMMFPRKKSDDVDKMETGDKIRVKGHVFSTALNEPWLDVNEIEILEKVPPKEDQKEQECC